jgi:hypothetical protein
LIFLANLIKFVDLPNFDVNWRIKVVSYVWLAAFGAHLLDLIEQCLTCSLGFGLSGIKKLPDFEIYDQNF